MLTINQILQQGRYRIVNQLGLNEIGMGYEAFDNTLNKNVLLKEISENSGKVATAAQLQARKEIFAGKAKVLTAMRHESILPVKGYFSEVDLHYLVTDFIEGNHLGDLMEKKKSSFPLADVLRWGDCLLDALNYMHTLNPPIIHHEVKPQNVRLSPSGRVKLLVFSAVRRTGETANAPAPDQTFDAAALPYLPLEQIWDGLDTASKKVILAGYDEKSELILEQPLDARSDVYALSATLYHLLTARVPADALTRSIEILEGSNDPLQSPSVINPSVPKEVSDVLMKALEIKRENRFSSAIIMRQVLRTAIARHRERETNMLQPEDDALLEIPAVEEITSPLRVPQPAPKDPEIETGRLLQLDLIKEQLRQAETQRWQAEKRAANAEKRLLEAEEKHITVELMPVEPEPVEKFSPPEYAAASPETTNEIVVADDQTGEFSGLFAEPQAVSHSFKKAAAVGLFVLAGATVGIWTFWPSGAAESNQTVSSANREVSVPMTESTPGQIIETSPISTYRTTSEPNTQLPTTSQLPEDVNTLSNPPVAKIKIAATPTPALKKPAVTPAKTAETQKKVTLDDLLKDN